MIKTNRFLEESANEVPESSERKTILGEKVVPIKAKKTLTPLRIRKAPKGEIIRIAELGEELQVKKIEDGWAQLEDGTYCMAAYLE